jgi:predicted ester cyclase
MSRLPLLLAFGLTAALASQGAFAKTSEVARNKEIARTVIEEVLGKGKIEENEHLYAPNFTAHGLTHDAGREEDRASTLGWRSAVPDLRMTVDKIIVQGNLVAVRYIGEGHNTGEGNGLPATGKFARVSGMTIFRIVNGQITDEWTEYNELALLKQLGLVKE